MSPSPGPQLSGQGEQWRAALEHNKAVLASQEMEMKEYLRRQQVRIELQTKVREYFTITEKAPTRASTRL